MGTLGLHHSEETKRKISKKHKELGVGKWMTGRKLSEDTKKKISKITMGSNNPHWKGGISKDKKHLKELKQKWDKENYDRVIWHSNRRRIKKLNNGGSHTFGEWELLKKQYNYTCPSCGEKEPEIKLTEDHIIPLDKGGSDYIENIQPLCRSCNCKKHTKIIKYEFDRTTFN
jgi:5-methylcytosine-specific restriction endonuclease McrA